MRLRNAWIAARARNAARQGPWIAGIGGLAAVAMLSALVWVPQQLDARLHRQVAVLPMAPDSMPLVRLVDSLRARQRALPRIVIGDSLRDSLREALADSLGVSSVPNATRIPPPTTVATPSLPAAKPDSAAMDLMARISRARTAPLPDSYRALAEAPLIRAEPRVRVLLDSIELVEREREAHAALGGPGARYAALTSRLTVLGNGLVRIAEQRVSRAVLSSINTAAEGSDVIAVARPDLSADSTTVAQHDSTRAVLTRQLAEGESLLVISRVALAERDTQRMTLERRLRVDIPPVAMLVAALVVGLAVGYGVVLLREFRRPTVGDAAEVERLTAAPVLRHTSETATVRAGRSVRRARPGVPRIIDRESDTFVVLHLALTGVGDVVEDVDVLAADPVIAAAVALGTAAAAVRESRAVLVVEEPRRAPVLARLLGVTKGTKRQRAAAAAVRSHVVTLERDACIDVRFEASGASAIDVNVEPTAPVDARYDLRLHLPSMDDIGESDASRAARDVIVCVRQGATPLAWLTRAMQHARRRQQRVRAVVLWSRDLPAGS